MRKQPADKRSGRQLFLSPHQTTCLWISSGTRITFKQCTLLSCQHFTTSKYRAQNLCFDFLFTSSFNGTCWEPFQNKMKVFRKQNCCICSPDWRSTWKLLSVKCSRNVPNWNSKIFQSLTSKHNTSIKLWKLVKLHGFGKRYSYS